MAWFAISIKDMSLIGIVIYMVGLICFRRLSLWVKSMKIIFHLYFALDMEILLEVVLNYFAVVPL